MDATAAKQQRLGASSSHQAPCPVTLEMIEEYEQFAKSFKLEVHNFTGGNGKRTGEAKA